MTHGLKIAAAVVGTVAYTVWLMAGVIELDEGTVDGWPRWVLLLWHLTTWFAGIVLGFSMFIVKAVLHL